MGERINCGHCGRRVSAYRPKGGDGSVLNANFHHDRSTLQGCKGSNEPGKPRG